MVVYVILPILEAEELNRRLAIESGAMWTDAKLFANITHKNGIDQALIMNDYEVPSGYQENIVYSLSDDWFDKIEDLK